MRTPPQGFSSSTTFQSMCARRASALAARQQRIDEVNAGLDRDHHAGFEHAREAQVRVARRAARRSWPVVSPITPPTSCTCRPSRCPMPCGKNTLVTPASRAACPGIFVRPTSMHDIAQDAVRGEVHIAIIAAGHDLVAQLQLRAIRGLHEIGESAGCTRVGAGDIGGVTAILRPRVDQERTQRRRCHALQVLVVQNRGIFVVGHDIVVRHFLLALRAGSQICHMRCVFGVSAAKRRERRAMAARAKCTCLAHAVELIGSFHGAVVMQSRQELRRIEVCRVDAGRRVAIGCR